MKHNRKSIFHYETRLEPLHSSNKFYVRLGKHILASITLIIISLGIGIWGYSYFENLSFIDALLNASMILGGMGPVNLLQTEKGKIFASFYSLYSGFVVLISAGFITAPIAHRILHRFHLEQN